MKAAKGTVGPGADRGRAAGAHLGLAAALVPAAASPTAGHGVGAIASLDQLADLPCQIRARNGVLPADPNLRHLWIGRGQDQGPDLLTVATEL